jgi:hypothetical protein
MNCVYVLNWFMRVKLLNMCVNSELMGCDNLVLH